MDAVSPGGKSPITCVLAASSWASVRASDLPRLRSQVVAAFPKTLTLGTLKHADEQIIVALFAVRQALDAAALDMPACESWAIVAAPQSIGRRRVAESIVRFRDEGAWSMSPHIIPHCSLHSLPGMLSQALGQHGPNFGAGGIRGCESEAMWAALPLLQQNRWPGAWVVLTGWDHDRLPNHQASCQAAVLGLRAGAKSASLPQVGFVPEAAPSGRIPFTLESVGRAIRERLDVCWDLDGAACSLSFTAHLEAAA
jgi:hypothetical protein